MLCNVVPADPDQHCTDESEEPWIPWLTQLHLFRPAIAPAHLVNKTVWHNMCPPASVLDDTLICQIDIPFARKQPTPQISV